MIDLFRGDYSFLSNFHDCKISIDGLTYSSAEAAYQALKCKDIKDREQFVNMTPRQAKKIGRTIVAIEDLEEYKDVIMLNVVYEKFKQNPDLLSKLLATGDEVLVEGNTWGDHYWGICDNYGENMLGRILMTVRQLLK